MLGYCLLLAGLILLLHANLRHKPKNVALVLGSGGHTAEMVITLKQVAVLHRKAIRTIYLILSQTDHNSLPKFHRELGQGLEHKVKVIRIPRSREVGQSYLTSVFTTLYSLVYSLVVLRVNVSLLICNGPGTCLPVILVLRLYNLMSMTVIFLESYCRVKSLSLTGRIVSALRLADEFIVHWPELEGCRPGVKYLGQLF